MDTTLTIDGEVFTLVGVQRGKLAVYRGTNSYLRIGSAEAVARDLRTHREMAAAGFPVANIMREGEHKGSIYYVESSQGTASFRTLFSTNMPAAEGVAEEHFTQFMLTTERYLRPQLTTVRPGETQEFKKKIKVDTLCEELPAMSERIQKRYADAIDAMNAFPYVLSHGDYNPANMYESGIIDLEDSMDAPFGYDAIAAISTIDWVPPAGDYEYSKSYSFSPEQRTAYLRMIDGIALENGLPPVSDAYTAFEFCRAVWMVSGLAKWPKARAYLHDRFMRAYKRE